jgi:uncharacterized integral membrane protein
MRKVKIAFWVILAALLGLVVSQNLTFFLEPGHLRVNFYFAEYFTPDFPMVLFFLVVFFAGLLIAYVSGLSEKFIAKKTIRNLNSEVAAAKKKIAEMEGNAASMKAEIKAEPVLHETETSVIPAQTADTAE